MNTVKIGDIFEDKCYDLIEHAVKNDKLGISASHARVFRKKKYYSDKRKKDIIFDLAIEIWPEDAKNYSMLLIIECKNYRTKDVPVDDVEEFESKVDQVSGKNAKAIMISARSFQEGAFNFAKSTGMMLIEAHQDDYNIILHRKSDNEDKESEDPVANIIFNFIRDTLGFNKVLGLEQLSIEDIAFIASEVISNYRKTRTPIEASSFLDYLRQKYNINFDLNNRIISSDGTNLFGCCDVKNRVISIDKSIVNTNRFFFVLGHELGHIFLHSKLKINQEHYQRFQDSHYNAFADKHLLVNEKQWIEWQANQFSVALFLPKPLFIYEFITYRKNLGIRSFDHIYLDDQTINQHDFIKTINHLSNHFGVSKTSIKYRINELGLLTDKRNMKKAIDIARNIIEEF